MGKKRDLSKKRKRLIKNFKKLLEKLEDCPPCSVLPCPGTQCGPPGCSVPCNCSPQMQQDEYKCFLVPNSDSKRTSSYSLRDNGSCGPFPSCCTGPFSCNPCIPCSNTPQSVSFPNGVCCCPQDWCYGGCTCFNNYYGNCCVPCCCRQKCCCINSCACCNSTCCQPQRCRVTYKKCPTGCICGNNICLPRACSDTSLVKKRSLGKPLMCTKSVELRGGVLYRGCDCNKKNGLQDRCPRFCCINNPKCRRIPASCHCSKFSCGQHLYRKKHKSVGYTCYIGEASPICNFPRMQQIPQSPAIHVMPLCCCGKKKKHHKKHKNRKDQISQYNPSPRNQSTQNPYNQISSQGTQNDPMPKQQNNQFKELDCDCYTQYPPCVCPDIPYPDEYCGGYPEIDQDCICRY